MTEEQQYLLARKRVKEKKSFYAHLSSYLVVGAFFVILNALTSFGRWWFYWPMLGWGIGLGMQYLKVFGLPGSGMGSSEWEERELEKEMRRLDSGRPNKRVKMDDHLELREIEKDKTPQPSYKKDDLV